MTEYLKVPKKRDDTLKLIALTTMLIDHMGYLLFPQYFILRIIGRISFPIFAYLIAQGVNRTSDPLSYALRLLSLGLISQVPYNLFTHHPLLSFNAPNIFFTLFAGLLMLLCLKHESIAVKPFSLLLLLIAAPLNLSYSYYGMLLILVFYLFEAKPLRLAGGMFFASLQYYVQFNHSSQFYALAVLPLILWPPKLGIRVHKWVGYLFYPVHLLLLFAVYFFWF